MHIFLTTFFSRNKLFFKFPGRDIGGFWGLFKPLALESWLAILLFAIVLPGFLFLCYRVLKKFNISETFSFGYGQNLFILLNAFSQQVVTYLGSLIILNSCCCEGNRIWTKISLKSGHFLLHYGIKCCVLWILQRILHLLHVRGEGCLPLCISAGPLFQN